LDHKDILAVLGVDLTGQVAVEVLVVEDIMVLKQIQALEHLEMDQILMVVLMVVSV
jgi:hypothetical protein